MDSLPNAVCWKDTNSRYLACNQAFAELAGIEPERVFGLRDADMPWSANAQRNVELDRRVIDENASLTDIRESMQTHDGDSVWLSINRSPLHDDLGNVIGLVGTFRDITAEVEAEADLHRALALLDTRVAERTGQLVRANQSLRKEVDERVRLQAEERQLREYAEIRRDLGAAMSRTLDLDKVLDIFLGGAQDLVSSDLVAIILAEDGALDLARLECSFDYRVDAETVTEDALCAHPSIQTVGCAFSHDDHDTVHTLGRARSSIAVEMVTGGHLIGYLLLESRWSNFYVAEHGQRLRGVAEQAAAVISNIRMTERAADLAATAERNRLRRDLHDSVVQTLAATTIAIDTELLDMPLDDPARPGLERIQRLASVANTELRQLLNEMRPNWADKCLVELVRDLAERPDWPFSIDMTSKMSGVPIDEQATTSLFRITQEALHNAARHARASRVVIELNDQGPVRLRVCDDGTGFDSSRVSGDHLGLSIMAERAREIDARLVVDTSPGAGTTVSIVAGDSRDTGDDRDATSADS